MVRFSEYFIKTQKEDPSSSEVPSYTLCLRAGLIKKIAAGIYTFLPLGYRVLKKIEKIVREEMDRTGALELLMPAIQPADLWIQSERWFQYGPELFRLKDRNEREFCLGPTHEEIMTHIAYLDIKSYKDLPVNLYQIQVKFRDEMRPRYGILRAREFIMKDAYSFSANDEELGDIYNKMYEAYSRILDRLDLKYYIVEADTGLIGGKYSHEFIISAANGEDELVYCPECGYAANYEMASFKSKDGAKEVSENKDVTELKKKEVHTPGVSNIKSLIDFLKVSPASIIKTMLLTDEEKNIYAVLLGGDKELNLSKLEKVVGKKLDLIEKTDDNEHLNIGYAGPSGLDDRIKIYADNSIAGKINLVSGANKKDYHFININYPRDFNVAFWGDFTFPDEDDLCIKCGSALIFEKGIEVGHVFKLGTKYSEKMSAMFLDNRGKSMPIIMGCYGFGVSRALAASIEQLSDKNGIIWPDSIAPFLVNVIATNMEDDEVRKSAEEVYKKISSEGLEVIFDDRYVRAGVKFKDSDLIGIPIKLIVGKNYIKDKKIEIELRTDRTKSNMGLTSTIDYIKRYSAKKHPG
jgi:prolyl-tRNA synthetase